jgi:hypothetical protein
MSAAKRKTKNLRLDEYDWVGLFAQFRENPDAPHVSRVRRILELLKAFTPELKGRAALHVSAELNARMKEYQWRSLVTNSTQGVIEVLRAPFGVTGVKEWEYNAVRLLLDLLRSRGQLDFVHLCEMHGKRPMCAGWYYGRSNKGVCSDACKQYRYDSQDEVKARRAQNAKYNRDHRANQKRLQESAKAAARLEGRGDYRFRASKASSVKKGRKIRSTAKP